jgi:glutathionylspermidine synthase
MAEVNGYVTVYESTDGGSGKPEDTLWQFFVEGRAVTTRNPNLAETMRLAIDTNSKVRVSFNEADKVMLQARIEFKYICESREVMRCEPNSPVPTSQNICEMRRSTPCKPGDVPEQPTA